MNELKINIRKATIKDFSIIDDFQVKMGAFEKELSPTLRKLYRKGEARSRTAKEIKDYLQSAEALVLIAEVNGKPVGCGLAEVKKVYGAWSKFKYAGKMGLLFVEKKYRNKGVAEKIFKTRVRWLKSKKVAFITIKVLAENKKVLSWYHKRGFEDYMIEMKL